MLFFALVLHPFVKELSTAFPSLALNARYADGGTLSMPRSVAPHILTFLDERGSSCGFNIVLRKQQRGGRLYLLLCVVWRLLESAGSSVHRPM